MISDLYWYDAVKLCDQCIGCEAVGDGETECLCLLESVYDEV